MYSGLFVHEKSFSFADTNDFADYDVWRDALESGDLIPLNFIQEFEQQNEETVFVESQQNYNYRARKGKYSHIYKFDWTLDYHQIVETLSEKDYYVIPWDRNWNLRATERDGVIQGFSVNHIVLKEMEDSDGTSPALSPLSVEYTDPDEWNVNGVTEQVTWNPEDINRLFMSITVDYVDSDNLNFSASWLGDSVDDISSSDITVTDDINGVLSFALFNYLGGVYQLSNFSASLTTGTLSILSDLYLGCSKYKVAITVSVTNRIAFENLDTLITEVTLDNLIYEN
jgi:hypothetical protein